MHEVSMVISNSMLLRSVHAVFVTELYLKANTHVLYTVEMDLSIAQYAAEAGWTNNFFFVFTFL